MSITVYSRNNCMQCKMTKKYLNAHKLPFEEHNLNNEPEYREVLKAKGFMSAPVVELDDGTAFTGFRPDELRKLSLQNES